MVGTRIFAIAALWEWLAVVQIRLVARQEMAALVFVAANAGMWWWMTKKGPNGWLDGCFPFVAGTVLGGGIGLRWP